MQVFWLASLIARGERMSEIKKQKAIILGLDDKQKRLLKVLLKHQEAVCRLKEDERRKEYER